MWPDASPLHCHSGGYNDYITKTRADLSTGYLARRRLLASTSQAHQRRLSADVAACMETANLLYDTGDGGFINILGTGNSGLEVKVRFKDYLI